jgi:hypothetical protein
MNLIIFGDNNAFAELKTIAKLGLLHRWKCAESALHTFRLISYVCGHEMETMFVVPGAFSCGRCAHFSILHEPGGYWAGRGRTERRIVRRRVLTTSENHWKSFRRDNPGDRA